MSFSDLSDAERKEIMEALGYVDEYEDDAPDDDTLVDEYGRKQEDGDDYMPRYY